MSQEASSWDRRVVQRRTLGVLWAAAIFSRGGFSALFPVSVSAIEDLLGSETWAGLATAAGTFGSAISAVVLASFMQRRGRNPGLTFGFAAAGLGSVLAIVSIQAGVLWTFLLAMVLVGVGLGASNLSRYAAADLSTEERRSRDISTVIFAATFGAVLFPLFIGIAGDFAERLGLHENAGGFGIATVLFVLASLVVFVMMRPDPLAVAGALGEAKTDERSVSFLQAVEIAWSRPLARLALIALVVSQAVMVMVMAMTPLHMEAHGHGKGAVGAVISVHTAGMFAFAPLAGWLSDRLGRIPVIAMGGATLVLATLITALASDAPRLLMFPGLYLLGLGWSFGIVAGSALLTESVDRADRVVVQGASEMATNIASGAGALVSGVVLSAAGFHILSLIGTAAAGAMLLHAWFEGRLDRNGANLL